MFRHPKLRPKTHIPGLPDDLYDFAGNLSLPRLSSIPSLSDNRQDHGIYRVKRKHVLKACDRCRVKKTKCDGKQPCNRCSTYNHPCLFRERKATQAKVYSRGFVEMLESHHSLVVKGLQTLYKHCVNKEGFPGEPLAEGADGNPLTHEILDRLGLIKQAEEGPDEPGETAPGDLRYLQLLLTSTETSSQSDPSPEPVTPPDPSPMAATTTTTSTMTNSACSSIIPSPSMEGNITWHRWTWHEAELPSTAFSHLLADYEYAGGAQMSPVLSPSISTGPVHAQLHNFPVQYHHPPHGHDNSYPLFFNSDGMHNEQMSVSVSLPVLMSVEGSHPHPPFS